VIPSNRVPRARDRPREKGYLTARVELAAMTRGVAESR